MLTGQWKVKPRWPPMESNFGRQLQSPTRACTSVCLLPNFLRFLKSFFLKNTQNISSKYRHKFKNFKYISTKSNRITGYIFSIKIENKKFQENWNWRLKFPSTSGHLDFTFFPSKWLGVSIPVMEIEFSAAHQLTSRRGSGDENVSFQKTGVWWLPGIIRGKASSWKAETFLINDEKGSVYSSRNRKFCFTTGAKGPTGVNAPVVITLKNALDVLLQTLSSSRDFHPEKLPPA